MKSTLFLLLLVCIINAKVESFTPLSRLPCRSLLAPEPSHNIFKSFKSFKSTISTGTTGHSSASSKTAIEMIFGKKNTPGSKAKNASSSQTTFNGKPLTTKVGEKVSAVAA